jgi:hypothetical protein
MKTAMQEFIEKHFYINAEGQYEAKYTEDTIWTEYINEALEKEKQQHNKIIADVFEYCWNHDNWNGKYDITDMNYYINKFNNERIDYTNDRVY